VQAATAAAEQIRSAKKKKKKEKERKKERKGKQYAATIRFTPALLRASLPDDNTRAR
jgi:hypothetical protein